MNVVCISASNMKSSGDDSTSLKLSRIVRDACFKMDHSIQFTVFDLRQFEFRPCEGCGSCFHNDGRCKIDESFNAVSKTIYDTDALFIVSPHYAPIPAKLVMLLEKLEQNAFLRRFNDEAYRSPLFGKPLGILGHGGGTEDLAQWYKGVVIESIANALSYPIEMKKIDYDENNRDGMIVSVEKVGKNEESIFPVQEYDWEAMRRQVEAYAGKVLRAAGLSDGAYQKKPKSNSTGGA